jgi:hypothetical protein
LKSQTLLGTSRLSFEGLMEVIGNHCSFITLELADDNRIIGKDQQTSLRINWESFRTWELLAGNSSYWQEVVGFWKHDAVGECHWENISSLEFYGEVTHSCKRIIITIIGWVSRHQWEYMRVLGQAGGALKLWVLVNVNHDCGEGQWRSWKLCVLVEINGGHWWSGENRCDDSKLWARTILEGY